MPLGEWGRLKGGGDLCWLPLYKIHPIEGVGGMWGLGHGLGSHCGNLAFHFFALSIHCSTFFCISVGTEYFPLSTFSTHTQSKNGTSHPRVLTKTSLCAFRKKSARLYMSARLAGHWSSAFEARGVGGLTTFARENLPITTAWELA
jgi:hypothetical protein